MNDDDSAEHDILGQMRGGLVFVKTQNRPAMVQFYQHKLNMKIWLEQPDITILSHGNMLVGFHNQPDLPAGGIDTGIMFTFVYPTKAEVDTMYEKFKDSTAGGPPRENERYRIYQFFAKDPEGRNLEFQVFLHSLDVVVTSAVE